MKSRFNAGDFAGGVIRGAEEIIEALSQAAPAAPRLAQGGAVPATSEFPALTGRVVDDAGILDATTRESLRAQLAALEVKTTDQLVVATVKSLNGNSIEDYANRLFRRWQLGQRGKNNGVLLLVAPNERKVRIEVGYGLEGTLTDAATKFIIERSILPRFRANDFPGGITRGANDLVAALSGSAQERQQVTGRSEPQGSGERSELPDWLLFGVIVVIFIIPSVLFGGLRALHALLVTLGLARKRPRKGFWRWVHSESSGGSSSGSSDSWSSSSWSSSSGSSDSFSGGGGDSGGGGSSGSW
jgi:uncharacterized protein